ncbi:MAG: hypothetical protein ABI844_15225 [Saprospiraceae bacterium]
MSTELKKITDAYASMLIATYEPLIVQWYSGISICSTASALATRMNKRVSSRVDTKFSTAQELIMDRSQKSLPLSLRVPANTDAKNPSRPLSNTMRPLDEKLIKSVTVEGFPEAILYNGKVYLNGIMDTELRESADKILIDKSFQANPETGLRQIPITVNRNYSGRADDINFQESFNPYCSYPDLKY